MIRSPIVLTALVALAFPAASQALVTAEISGGNLLVSGTVLKDNIRVRVVGSTLRVSDTGRVNGRDGCSQAGDEASCPVVGLVQVKAGASDDSVTLLAASPKAVIEGGSGNDSLVYAGDADGTVLGGDSGNDVLRGAAGDETLDGGGGADRLEAGSGNDALRGDGSLPDSPAGPDELHGDAGDDTLSGDGSGDLLIGGPGFDAADYHFGQAVVATIGGPAANNGGDAAGDTISPLSIEALIGSSRADVLTGDDGDNLIVGKTGADTIDGAGGNDVLRPGGGKDVVDGGAGSDLVSYSEFSEAVRIVLGGQGTSGPIDTIDDEGVTIENVEDGEGGSGSDALFGSFGANRLAGGPGNDTITAGGEQRDGPDRFEGGPGFDTVSYAGRLAGIVVSANGVADDGAPTTPTDVGEGDNVGRDVEGLVGGNGSDTLFATTGSGQLRSPNGESTFVLGSSTVPIATRLDGGPGGDSLRGSPDADALVGGPGLDSFSGFGGNDALDASGDAEAEIAFCGEGDNDLAKLDLVDTQIGCEGTQFAAVGRHPTVTIPPTLPTLSGRVLKLALACPRKAAGACRGKLDAALASGSALGTSAFNVPRGARRALRLRLGPAAARRLRGAGRVRLTTHEQDPEGRPKTATALRRIRH